METVDEGREDGGWRADVVSGRRAVGTICIQLLWYDKEACYEHLTLLASITILACATLIGGDLSTQSSYADAKWIINSYTCVGLSALCLCLCSTALILCRHAVHYHEINHSRIIYLVVVIGRICCSTLWKKKICQSISILYFPTCT